MRIRSVIFVLELIIAILVIGSALFSLRHYLKNRKR